MRKLVPLAITLLLAGLGACRPGTTMWTPCTPGNDPTATDGHYVLVCKDNLWQPIMTVDEFVRIRRGEPVVIAPLPTRPTSTTTTTTVAGPTTSTTTGPTSTTSTSVSTTTTTTSTTTSTTTTTAPTSSPGITSITPNTGAVAGGTTVTIVGTSFTTATLVSFGGIAAVSFTVNSDTQITAVTPAHASGLVSVVVNNTVGGTTATNAFTYV